ncbi:tyrosine-type recombinase/integrase [Nocardia sp. CY41]|uniref:tyrosine-type recombinase/integrase n=1 Tax=Nocardia sp. CY41 TaxID=2608686 RepID=UPI0013579BD2|nr:tyrosine-type recombinase/integrase [Nocardia sp. CY41]
MADRTRSLKPLLPLLVEHVEYQRRHTTELLTAASRAAADELIAVDSRLYRRLFTSGDRTRQRRHGQANVRVREESSGQAINVTLLEDTAFWSWAIVETLRHTGLRNEELLELSQLSIRQYQRPNGEVIALLVVAPSKSDRERVIPMSVELFHVIACIIHRLTRDQPTVPLSTRYDVHERITSEPQPFLFQRHIGQRNEVMAPGAVGEMLRRTCVRLADKHPEFAERHFTPHDFRRLFATDMVNHGLPIHIGAALLGHLNLETTRGYVAVFQEDVVRHYQSHLARRRAMRPEHEYQPVTDTEWTEFEEHFDKRKLELGNCGRPYATPCSHEHACIRCPMLHIDPKMLPRLEEIETDLLARQSRARAEGWLGELEGIDLTLTFLRDKRKEAERVRCHGPVTLGMPASTRP